METICVLTVYLQYGGVCLLKAFSLTPALSRWESGESFAAFGKYLRLDLRRFRLRPFNFRCARDEIWSGEGWRCP